MVPGRHIILNKRQQFLYLLQGHDSSIIDAFCMCVNKCNDLHGKNQQQQKENIVKSVYNKMSARSPDFLLSTICFM